LPRMADFALWATACETSLWPAGTFCSAYGGNLAQAVEGVIDADPVASAVRAMLTQRTEWTGTASELLDDLSKMTSDRLAKSKAWPDSPRAVSGRLRRAATFLRKVGIEISYGREGRARTRTIKISVTTDHPAPEKLGAQPSAPSLQSASRPKLNPVNEFPAGLPRTVANHADDSGKGGGPIVRANLLKTNVRTAADDADANLPRQSAMEKAGAPAWSKRL
jgi:hypothetical protein